MIRARLAPWYAYQRERFPIVAHGLLIAAFSSAAICFSAALRGAHHVPSPAILGAGFLASFVLFLQMRICDEHKDAADDARYRPYRPVPRGIVTLAQLRTVGIVAGIAVTMTTTLAAPMLLALLAAVWLYLALMTREFFIPRTLRRDPVAYMLSHGLIIPLIDFFVGAFDWLPAHAAPSPAFLWFLAVSFCNGIALEIGRKIRAPRDEEDGVETYSRLWGRPGAIGSWLAVTACSGAFALGAAHATGTMPFEALVLACIFVPAVVVGVSFLRTARSGLARAVESVSGIWTLALYLGLGTIPLLAGGLR